MSSKFCLVLSCFCICRKGCILRLQRHLHELLLDQLPVLRQLARVLDELSLGVDNAAAAAAAGNAASASRLILEQVRWGIYYAGHEGFAPVR